MWTFVPVNGDRKVDMKNVHQRIIIEHLQSTSNSWNVCAVVDLQIRPLFLETGHENMEKRNLRIKIQ